MKTMILLAAATLAMGASTGASAQQGAPGGNPQDTTAVQQQRMDTKAGINECAGLSDTALTRCQIDQRNDRLDRSSARGGTPASGGSMPSGRSRVNSGGIGTDPSSSTGVGGGSGGH